MKTTFSVSALIALVTAAATASAAMEPASTIVIAFHQANMHNHPVGVAHARVEYSAPANNDSEAEGYNASAKDDSEDNDNAEANSDIASGNSSMVEYEDALAPHSYSKSGEPTSEEQTIIPTHYAVFTPAPAPAPMPAPATAPAPAPKYAIKYSSALGSSSVAPTSTYIPPTTSSMAPTSTFAGPTYGYATYNSGSVEPTSTTIAPTTNYGSISPTSVTNEVTSSSSTAYSTLIISSSVYSPAPAPIYSPALAPAPAPTPTSEAAPAPATYGSVIASISSAPIQTQAYSASSPTYIKKVVHKAHTGIKHGVKHTRHIIKHKKAAVRNAAGFKPKAIVN
ncbi:hypothetical protein GGF37_000544 [Kickxella alabastrina]|nr:hypothetical protein GGF37_000544 [Kickxella alabastrina]